MRNDQSATHQTGDNFKEKQTAERWDTRLLSDGGNVFHDYFEIDGIATTSKNAKTKRSRQFTIAQISREDLSKCEK